MEFKHMKLAKYIDHTLLKPEAAESAILALCQEAKEYQFKSVCVQPYWVKTAAAALQDSDVLVCTVIGFPHGMNTPETKAFETKQAIAQGADEVDMVINIGATKTHDYDLVKRDIAAVVQAANGEATTKVIIETTLLTDEEKVTVCQLAKEVGADFVKTSTGFAGGGATIHDVTLMRQTVGEDMGVKASGGVRTYEDAIAFIEAGATRLGASSGVAIVTNDKNGIENDY